MRPFRGAPIPLPDLILPAAIFVDGDTLSLEVVEAVARGGRPVALHPDARRRMEESRRVVEAALDSERPVYGLNTGFGRLAGVRIASQQIELLQQNLIRSHCAGLGSPIAEEAVRAILLLRANCLAKGFSGVRPLVVERLLDLLNARLHPVVPRKGSVGASGDLAPLAQVALALIGEGEIWVRGERRPAGEALQAAGLAPLSLAAKEGLSLINGTQVSTAIGALTLLDAERLATHADIAAALSLEALKGSCP
jgi:histidine ammonia-lyase